MFRGILFFCGVLMCFNGYGSDQSQSKGKSMSTIEKIEMAFNTFDGKNLDVIDENYDENVQFADPVVQFQGRDQLKKYFKKVYANVNSIEFKFVDVISQGEQFSIAWEMTMRAKGLNGGQPYKTPGVSIIKLNPENKKIVYHRDYVDLGAMVYEQLPLIKNIIRFVKGQMH